MAELASLLSSGGESPSYAHGPGCHHRGTSALCCGWQRASKTRALLQQPNQMQPVPRPGTPHSQPSGPLPPRLPWSLGRPEHTWREERRQQRERGRGGSLAGKAGCQGRLGKGRWVCTTPTPPWGWSGRAYVQMAGPRLGQKGPHLTHTPGLAGGAHMPVWLLPCGLGFGSLKDLWRGLWGQA